MTAIPPMTTSTSASYRRCSHTVIGIRQTNSRYAPTNHSGETTISTAWPIQLRSNTIPTMTPRITQVTSSAADGMASDLACRSAKCQIRSPRADARSHDFRCT